MALIPFSAHALGCPSRQLGMLASALGDFEGAERLFMNAFERDRALGANVAAIQDRQALAEMYRGRGSSTDCERARELALGARSDALSRGLTALAAELQVFLKA